MASTPQYFDDKTAVILCDHQNFIMSLMGSEEAANQAAENSAKVLEAARRKGIFVGHVCVRFRPGEPEIHPNNKMFQGFLQKFQGQTFPLEKGTQTAEFHEKVKPLDNEPVFEKRRVGAFSTTDLHTVLQAKGINRIVLYGFSTSGVILSTVRWAADADYNIVVIKDLCGDADEETHRVLQDKVFPRQADVITSDEALKQLA
eukprot:gb/GECG01015475.1/.p1 GENE.gb/GECG01015475.1/~~gb/GECG01015475.1/.p1  ORF type:complete len:202 (+),score=27.74 gb/GECG01015475.1/:1-606(+)